MGVVFTSCQPTSGEGVTIFHAAKVITMETGSPQANAVAIKEDRIVGVGNARMLKKQWQGATYSQQFKDKVIMPGLIDNHLHPSMAAVLLPMNFITPFDWDLPHQEVTGVRTKSEYLNQLKSQVGASNQDDWYFTWGYHHYFHGEISRADLDAISTTQPIVVWHRSFHEVYVNTAMLRAVGVKDSDYADIHNMDVANGHFYESGLLKFFPILAQKVLSPEWFSQGLALVKETVHQGGVTTIADQGFGLFNLEMEWPFIQKFLENESTPFRTYLIYSTVNPLSDKLQIKTMAALKERNGHRVQFVDQIKIVGDGAFFSLLMQMKDGYLDGHEGEWITPPDAMAKKAKYYWDAGYQLHIHSNGDKSHDVVMDIIEGLIKDNPKADHRTTLHHLGYSTDNQSKRMAELGILVSAQPYYFHVLGDKYSEMGLGPDRAESIFRGQSLIDAGVPLSLHSDFTMAPVKPLTLAWVAANRITGNGNELAPDLRISVDDALRGVTIEAAYAIQMEDEIGSIKVGKKADFTILEQDPYAIPPENLKDIPIWGTVFEGEVFPIKK